MESPPSGDILDQTPESLGPVLGELGEPAYRARQVLHGIYHHGRRRFDAMTDLPKTLRRRLAERFSLEPPRVRDVRQSGDGSRKYLLELRDGREIESVYLVDGERRTFCISSQVGCAFGCDFCLTARMKLVRQLSPGEIVGQVLRMADEGGHGREGYNVVFMGMGEPLHNLDALATALELLLGPDGLAMSRRRVTVSTVGLPDGIRRLARLPRRPRLAVSLNAASDALRSRMMPVNRSHPLDELFRSLGEFPLSRGDRITFEYVLMAGVNDAAADADALARRVRGIPSKVNVIPFNEDPALPYRRPETAVAEAFRDRLLQRKVAASIRWSRGADIRAACGQLAVGG
ncbi:MAG: 23S rRNA (adenine(2503)-C(2))-methyltransferase RlmN [Acidobacteriota bacterium]|jgi:23S rRNA (adenine2503-C2)-methyltransferase